MSIRLKTMDKENLKSEGIKWGKRVAFFAVFGFTGLAFIGVKKAYEHYKDR